jgi:hypothetical protein
MPRIPDCVILPENISNASIGEAKD